MLFYYRSKNVIATANNEIKLKTMGQSKNIFMYAGMYLELINVDKGCLCKVFLRPGSVY